MTTVTVYMTRKRTKPMLKDSLVGDFAKINTIISQDCTASTDGLRVVSLAIVHVPLDLLVRP